MIDQEFESWRNRKLSALVESLEPVKTSSWACNMNAIAAIEQDLRGRITGLQFYREMTSAEQAKYRLHGIVAKDRKACGDGKWVKVRNRRLCGIPWQISLSESPIAKELVKEWEREDKLAYRWKYRR